MSSIMAEFLGEIFWVIVKSFGVVFIKVFTFSTTPLKEIYQDDSKNFIANTIGILFFIALFAILIYYNNR